MSGSAVISTMVHAAESRGGMLHMLSVQRSFVLLENIILLGIVLLGLFIIVNLDVTRYSQVITTHPGLVCMPAFSVRLDWGLEKYLMVQGRLGARGFSFTIIFLAGAATLLHSPKLPASCVWSLYFWHWAKPNQWRVWNLLCKLVPKAYGHSHDIVGVVTAGAHVPNISSGFAFQDVKIEIVSSGGRCWGVHGNGAWGLRGQSTSHCSLPGLMLDCDNSEIGLCKTYLKFRNCSTGR